MPPMSDEAYSRPEPRVSAEVFLLFTSTCGGVGDGCAVAALAYRQWLDGVKLCCGFRSWRVGMMRFHPALSVRV